MFFYGELKKSIPELSSILLNTLWCRRPSSLAIILDSHHTTNNLSIFCTKHVLHVAKQQNTHTRLCSCTVWPGFSLFIYRKYWFSHSEHHWAKTSENVPSDMCTQQRFRSACAFAVWSESSLGTFWAAIGAKFLHAKKALIRLCGCASSSSSLGAHVKRYIFSWCCPFDLLFQSSDSIHLIVYTWGDQLLLI